MRLGTALDPILVVASVRGQKLHDVEHAAAPAAPVRSGRVVHRLPDLELVAAHIVTKDFSRGNGITKMPSATAHPFVNPLGPGHVASSGKSKWMPNLGKGDLCHG